MTIEDAFEHMGRAAELEEQVADHREQARVIIRTTVENELEYEADVDVELYNDTTAILEITPSSLRTLGRDLDEDGDYITSTTPSVVRISTADAELDMVFSEDELKSRSQRDRIKRLKELITALCDHYDDEPGAPIDDVLHHSSLIGMDANKAEQEVESLRRKGEVYEPQNGYIRTT